MTETISTTMQAVGAALMFIVLLRAILLLRSASNRMQFEREQHQLEVNFWQQKINASPTDKKEGTGNKPAWPGLRKFTVVKKEREAENICSFYLAPHDNNVLPSYYPGQHLTFSLNVPEHARPIVRCYSLSDCSKEEHYRITIKQLPAPPDLPDVPAGLASSYFHEQLQTGDILNVKAPSGHFYLDMKMENPVVLIGGGIGITPILSMLNAIAESGSRRETWLFYGVCHGGEHVMKGNLKALAQTHENIKLNVCYSSPRDVDVPGSDYHHKGWVNVDLMKTLLPSSNYHFYICGPAPMMDMLTEDLENWGVPQEYIHYEAFGPATVKRVSQHQTIDRETVEVNFVRSGKKAHWSPLDGSLLDLAEANGIMLDSGCRTGNCGTCLTAIRSGAVEYLNEPGIEPDTGTCLTCIATPKKALELDA